MDKELSIVSRFSRTHHGHDQFGININIGGKDEREIAVE